MNPIELIDAWRKRRKEWSRLRVQVDGVAVADEVIRELEAMADAEDSLLSLTAAAPKCGYTADHLSRLIREGTLLNHGKKHSPRVKLSECPMKAAKLSLARSAQQSYDLHADARSLGARRLRRPNGNSQTAA